jgi:hypothetical protein
VKFEAILAGEKQMQIAAHNLGRGELALGADYLRVAAQRRGVALISANALDAASGKAIVETHRLVESAGRKLAIVGVVSPQFAAAGIRVTEPRQAVLDAVASVKGQFQSLIVLAYLPDEELAALAAALPEADVVLGGPTGQAMAPRRIGPTLLAAATNKGKFLVQLRCDPAGTWAGSIAEMNPKFADNADQLANLHAYLTELGHRNFTAQESGLAPQLPPNAPAAYRVSGSASCVSCHKNDHDTWTHSKHSHAWQSLEEKKFHVDPYCMQCHTTGFGLPGGFASRAQTPSLVSVGCESCHGPSEAHVAKPTVRTTFAAADQCLRCHDHENSPTFAYDAYWPRITHGKVRAASAVDRP